MNKKCLKYTLITIVIASMSWSIWQNVRVYRALRQADFNQANQLSRQALILPKLLNLITFEQIEILQLWEFALEQIPNLQQLANNLQQYLEQSFGYQAVDEHLPTEIITNLEKFNSDLNKIDTKRLKNIQALSQDLLVVAKKLLAEDQNYLVFLQNNDELRATGGFLGSFAILSFKNGQLQPFTIQDIYVPDGQFTGFVEAPSGLKEYLSSGKGMRLPDANWWPNFPDSAEQALYFIETTSKEQFQGVITFNLSLIEQLLALTGDIYLPDYNQTINQDNFAQIARADRDEFFAGSQEKANFLNHFLNIFKTRLIQTFQTQPQAFLSLLNNALTSKDIQIYSRDETIVQILQRRKLDGQMFDNGQALYYFLVESNVGINKANRQVTRQVDIALTAEAETINIYFQNGNQFPYINYQRLYTKRDTKLVQVLVNQQPVSLVDQKILSTQNGEWLEIGFLLAMLPGEESTVEIDLQSNVNLEQKKRLFVQKQSGLPAVQYTLHYQDQKQSIKLLSDQTIIFD